MPPKYNSTRARYVGDERGDIKRLKLDGQRQGMYPTLGPDYTAPQMVNAKERTRFQEVTPQQNGGQRERMDRSYIQLYYIAEDRLESKSSRIS